MLLIAASGALPLLPGVLLPPLEFGPSADCNRYGILVSSIRLHAPGK